jgi:cell division protein FtsB
MRNTTFAFAVTLALCCADSSAPAQVPAPDAAPSRYSFNRVDNGFLRLDNQSGQVAYCSPHAVGWACEAVPEDRAALEKEIARLQDEVASLKQQVASLREPPPPRPPAELSPPAENRDDAARLREDMERARAALEHAWRGLVDMIITFQKDMMRKG